MIGRIRAESAASISWGLVYRGLKKALNKAVLETGLECV
jgi:hypothetical protein